MASEAGRLPRRQVEKPRAASLDDRAQSTTEVDHISSFVSLKNQLAQVEGSLATKDASLALARDLLRAREEELATAQQTLALRKKQLADGATRIGRLETELEQAKAEVSRERERSAELTRECSDLRTHMISWPGILRALGRRLLQSVRYGIGS